MGSAAEPGSLRQFIREHRRVLLVLLGLAAATVFVLMILPQIAGFGDTLKRLRYGNKAWLGVAVLFEALSLAGYAALFRTVFSAEGVEIGWSASYQITMAGTVATTKSWARLLACTTVPLKVEAEA